ncbi:THUMP-like domain-containing protein [Aeromicrobium sp.]|uniref:class I SAM-dependent methyltransferase n=1 Tax=Aeromicrobium sp. TaxID=1871063 RepID=UPI003D6A950B
MDLATFEQLLSPAGQDLLAEVGARAGIESDLALGTRLRRDHAPELVAAAVTQNHLRRRAEPKFGPESALLFFTHDALEQATRASVARARAARLVESGVTAVIDLGCGIGGDLVALARAGLRVRGVELDPVRAAVARANLAALGLDGEVVEGDLGDVAPLSDEVPFLDPARRDGRGRVFDPAAMTPSWDVVARHLARPAVVKALPGLPHHLVPEGVEAQWVSDGGDLVEACLWGPGLATAPRRATALPSGAELVGVGDPGEVGDVGTWLHEPDDAVIRAGLVGELARRMDGRLIDQHLAYVTTDEPASDALVRSFRIVEELPYREKQLRAALVARDVGTLTVKKRGVDVVPEDLIKRLKLKGTRPATVILARIDDGARAFLVETA